jgi:hypothetical protein
MCTRTLADRVRTLCSSSSVGDRAFIRPISVSCHVVVEVAILSFAFACVMANVSRGSTKKRNGGHLLFREVREKLGCSFHHLDDAMGQEWSE